MVKLILVRSWLSVAALVVLLTDGINAEQRLRSLDRNVRPSSIVRGREVDRRLGKSSKSRKCTNEYGQKTTCPPTTSPTASPAPSDSPTASPTSSPSVSPTSSPTDTVAPSTSPTKAPTDAPTASPTSAPSAQPTVSPMPSSSPSNKPTSAPSPAPSSKPSTSMAPTEAIFSLTKNDEGFDVSECLVSPELIESSTAETSMLSFNYFMYINETNTEDNAQSFADALEPVLHRALAHEAMRCQYVGVSSALIGLSSADEDAVSGQCTGNVTLADGEACWLVNAKITTTIFYVNGRRNLLSSEVLPDVVGWMQAIFPGLADSDDEIYKTEFDGFTALESLGGQTFADTSQQQDDQTGSAAAVGGNFKADDKNGNGGAVFLVTIAAAGLIAVVLFIVVRRNKRRDDYLKHAEEVDEISLDEDAKVSMAVKSGIVDIEAEAAPTFSLSLEEEHFEGIEIEDSNHDYRTCASPRCEICQSRPRNPVFISTGASKTKDVIESLSPPKHQRRSDVEYENTQML